MNTSMFKTIFFDFGNVIGFFDHHRATTALAKYTETPVAELHTLLHDSDILDQYEHGHISTAEYIRLIRERGRVRCSDEDFLTGFVDIFWPNPEVCRLIPRLKPRYRLVLASNTCEAHFTQFSAMFVTTLRHLDELGASHTLRARKPNANFYENAQTLAAADPGECLFIDDKPANVEAAERFGWRGILYEPDGSLLLKMRAAGVIV